MLILKILKKFQFRKFACKLIHGLHFAEDDEPIQEIKILKESKNENIIEYVDFFYENRFNVCILTRFYTVKRII